MSVSARSMMSATGGTRRSSVAKALEAVAAAAVRLIGGLTAMPAPQPIPVRVDARSRRVRSLGDR